MSTSNSSHTITVGVSLANVLPDSMAGCIIVSFVMLENWSLHADMLLISTDEISYC